GDPTADASASGGQGLVSQIERLGDGLVPDLAACDIEPVREHPRDAMLWTGLGNALADHSGMLTPASELAFRRAMALAPGYPGPRFFLGLALARSGHPEDAIALWRSILAEAPANASWRPFVEDSIRAIQPPPPPRQPQAAKGS
ncbi:MAG: hypothetical protein H7124_02805, partial [Phycisphaerales bacterium]|nr:hypothetical protein [Hyphomonadaceae bacterium]